MHACKTHSVVCQSMLRLFAIPLNNTTVNTYVSWVKGLANTTIHTVSTGNWVAGVCTLCMYKLLRSADTRLWLQLSGLKLLCGATH